KVTGPDTVLVDRYAYKAHEAAADRASGRTPDGGEWKLEDQLNPFTGTATPGPTGCPPTPGQPNSCGVTDVKRATWGRLQALYRGAGRLCAPGPSRRDRDATPRPGASSAPQRSIAWCTTRSRWIARRDVTPHCAIAISSSVTSSCTTRVTPSAPNAASPHR